MRVKLRERKRPAIDHVQLEEMLRQAQKMEALGTVAGSIAHDFNNILAGIMSFAELGVKEASDPLAAFQNFNQILKACLRARELVRRIRAFDQHPGQDSAPTSPGEETVEARGNGERVLFVDDEPVLAMIGERFLKDLGYNAVVLIDPRAALASFADQPFDIVVTDLTMPHLNGIEFAQRLWEVRPETRVILATGFSATLDPARARELGFRELLLKPYSIGGLGEVLQRVLNA